MSLFCLNNRRYAKSSFYVLTLIILLPPAPDAQPVPYESQMATKKSLRRVTDITYLRDIFQFALVEESGHV